MADGKVLRVIIGGKGYDLMGAFANAKMTDWKALLAATGRNPFAVAAGVDGLDSMKNADGMKALAGKAGTALMETIVDLVFLARREAGDRATVMVQGEPFVDKDRPITYEQVEAELSFFDALGAFETVGQHLAEEDAATEDPTTTLTMTASGQGAAKRKPAARKR